MSRNSLYRHSVWIDVFGVLAFAAFLLACAGALWYYGQDVVTASLQGRPLPETAVQNRGYSRVPSTPRRSIRSLPSSQREPRLSARTESGVESGTPFSKSWREEATPSLGALSAPGPGVSTRGRTASERGSAPPIASARRSGGTGDVDVRGGKARSGLRSEAARFSNRARSLSRQLSQMTHDQSSGGRSNSSSESSVQTRQGKASRSAGTGPPLPDREPSQVPIDDHLHWLLVAGVLWGAWRLWRV